MSVPLSSVQADPPVPETGRLRALLVALCAALALVVAGNSALAIALPEIAADLGADQSDLTWIIDGYALAFAALLLIAGLAADRFGRRTVLVVGLALFGAASFASAFSPSAGWLDQSAGAVRDRRSRGLPGDAVCTGRRLPRGEAQPRGRRLVRGELGRSGGGHDRRRTAARDLVVGQSAAAVRRDGSRPGRPRAAAGGAEPQHRSLSLDPLGAGWSVAALGGLVFGVIEGPQRGWTDPVTLGALLVGVVAAGGFVRHQLRATEPSLDVRLFARRGLVPVRSS